MSGTSSFDRDFDIKVKVQMKGHGCVRFPGSTFIVCCHLGTCMYVHGFGSMSGTPFFDLEFDLESQKAGQSHGCVRCQGSLAIVWDSLGARADVISGRCPVPRLITLNSTVMAKQIVFEFDQMPGQMSSLLVLPSKVFYYARVVGLCMAERRP